MMNNIIVLSIIMLVYGITLIVVVTLCFNKVLKHKSKLSNFIKDIDEIEHLVNTINVKESKNMINYRINKNKELLKKFRNA